MDLQDTSAEEANAGLVGRGVAIMPLGAKALERVRSCRRASSARQRPLPTTPFNTVVTA